MDVEAGQQLLQYRLIEKIGEGGMGVVWRAEDTALRRDVAIKILPPDLAGDPDRLARFGREARLLATLSHPNVAAVYGLHETNGTHFLAMELVRGEDLSDRIARGRLAVDDALEIARAVAEGLRSAHAGGVIHRDLKPANIRLTPAGDVKVLDFGLAKGLYDPAGEADAFASSLSPTVTSLGTVAGVLLGTAAYMSPEQARGKPVDRRADVWAFGCVLFEMLAGKTAFAGETVTDTLAAVVRAEPEWEALPTGLPRGVRRVLDLCLAKSPGKRLHDIADASILLERAIERESDPVPDAPQAGRPRWREGLAWTAAALALVAVIVLWNPRGDEESSLPLTRFTIQVDADAPLTLSPEPILAFSPDGRTIAFNATHPTSRKPVIFLRALDRGEAWLLPGTEGATNPFFSPDGRHVAFFAEGELRRVALSGGSPITLASASNPRGGVWLPDDTIVYSPEFVAGLWRVAASGGNPRRIADPDAEQGERTFRWPTVLPDGKTLLFTVGTTDSPNDYDRAVIAALPVDGGRRRTVLEGANMARYAGSGTLVFSRAGNLYGVPFDPQAVETTGEPKPVLDGVGGDPSSGAGYFDVSPQGHLIHVAGAVFLARARVVLVDREGTATALPMEPHLYRHPRFSPDGSALALTIGARGVVGVGGDVWIHSFATGDLRRVTFGDADSHPVWGPGGSGITYLPAESSSIASKPVDGTGEPEIVVRMDGGILVPNSWSADGKRLAFSRTARTTDVYLWTAGEAAPRLFLEDANVPAISPDGRWLAYSSPVSGNSVVYVEPVEGEGKWQIAGGVAGHPRWSPDGRRLFYIAIGEPGRPLMEVDVVPGGGFRYGSPRVVLADTGRYATATSPMMNWDTDGDRFAFIELVRDDAALRRFEVTLNWAAQLESAVDR